jgi:hypothetical protein
MTNPGTVKELIPEFFQDDDSFLINKLGLDLGVRQDKKRVNVVLLLMIANFTGCVNAKVSKKSKGFSQKA